MIDLTEHKKVVKVLMKQIVEVAPPPLRMTLLVDFVVDVDSIFPYFYTKTPNIDETNIEETGKDL